MRRILIATPVHRAVEPPYLTGLHAVLSNRYDGIEVLFEMLAGPPVNFARNMFVKRARERGATEILFIDADMGWEEEDFVRICAHTEPAIVGVVYCRRQTGRQHYHVNLKDGCEIDEKTGLCEVNAIATGFLKVKMPVFDAIEKKFPERAYDNEGGGFEWFPMGVVNRTLLGEDFYFCRLAKESGFPIYADFGARIIPHWGPAAFPLNNETPTEP